MISPKYLIQLISVLLTLNGYAQSERSQEKGLSFYLGYTTNKTTNAGVGYVRNKSSFSLGISTENNGQRGKAVSERLSNYGNTTAGTSSYFTGIDGTYERFITNHLALGVIGTIGNNRYFINYLDGRFNDDGYHYVIDKKLNGGFGGYLAYYFGGTIGISAGYHSLKEASFNLHVRLTN
jgi:hypothetical protein